MSEGRPEAEPPMCWRVCKNFAVHVAVGASQAGKDPHQAGRQVGNWAGCWPDGKTDMPGATTARGKTRLELPV